jgi:hypothetical protein
MRTFLNQDFIENLLKNYAQNVGFVSHQIESFNDFINNGISRVVCETGIDINNDDFKYSISFGDVYVPKPTIIEEDRSIRTMIPSEARQRDLTYDVPMFVDVIETISIDNQQPETTIHRRVNIGRTPIMLLSDKCNLKGLTKKERIQKGECEWDSGGYFLIKGKERVLIGQIRGIYNQPIVLSQKSSDKYKYVCEIRSMSEETGHSVLTQVKIGADDRTLVFSLPLIKELIPIGIVFKALGYTTTEQIIDIIGVDMNKHPKLARYIKYVIRDAFFIKTQEDALNYISQFTIHVIKDDKKISYTSQVVENELLPHMGIFTSIKEKTYFLGHMVNKLLNTVVGLRKEDDRDNYANKRVEMAGVLCCELFRTLFKRFVKSLELQIEKKKQKPDILNIISRTNSISVGLRSCFATGNWGVAKNNYIRTGVSQVLSRLSFGASLSHLRRITIPIGKEGKNAKIRQIHSSQFGFICPTECFDPLTEILLWSGEIKFAKDILIGDILIDEKGNPTKVTKTISGISPMYEIICKEKNFMNHIVTANHILTLKIKNNIIITKKPNNAFEIKLFDKKSFRYNSHSFLSLNEAQYNFDAMKKSIHDLFVDISIDEYKKLPDNIKNNLVITKCDVINWENKPTPMDPYILGLYLGEYTNKKSFQSFKNFKNILMQMNLWYEKNHIPEIFLSNDKNNRLKLLSGLIDANNHEYAKIIVNDRELKFIEDIELLINSLGFSCSTSNIIDNNNNNNFFKEIIIDDDSLNQIPYKKKKKLLNQIKMNRESNFFIVEKQNREFVGWQVEGNGRFLLKDTTIVHNTPEVCLSTSK